MRAAGIMKSGLDPRAALVALFRDAIAQLRADRLVEAAMTGADFSHVIALGKAGEALAAGAWRALGRRLASGFLAVPRGYESAELPPAAPFERHRGAHPIPDASSVAAGLALQCFVASLPASSRVAILLSGGASACIELPNKDVNLVFLRRVNEWLLASGLPIMEVNRVRAGLSRLKGGGLARLLARVQAEAWVLCDIPGGDIGWVGGAPLTAPPPGMLAALPEWLAAQVRVTSAAPPSVRLHRLAGNEDAVARIEERGASAGPPLEGEAEELGAGIGRALARAAPGLHVRGGEPVVALPAEPGRGGRCQQLALAAAAAFAGRKDCWLLAAGTDGRDGFTEAAGACVDGGTIARGLALGLDAGSALRTADAGSFLAASGDLLFTGPTGTNINDLVIALRA
ncbi:MAG TPA: DUF4147 domain-containing protein [Gammaproteobacteria bacterium]|nr:DUF4147 domain-containing protein [Gammaproteobacteria bacterium]